MSGFTGVSIITDGNQCTTTAVDTGTDNGYHLLVVKDYSRSVKEIPCGKSIDSRPFIVGGHQWYIEYCPNGEDQSCSDFISLYLCHHDEEMDEAVEVKFHFSFVDQVEEQKLMHITEVETDSFSIKDSCWGNRKFIKRDVLDRSAHLKEDCFTIRCDIMVCNNLNTQQDIRSDRGQHYKILLQDKLGSDVTFEVNSELFPAHRCVLAARSKVFKAQLFGPMAEGSTSSVIQIKDMDPKVFAALLSLIYTDSFPDYVEDQEEEQDEEDGGEEEGQEEEATEPVTWLQWLQYLFAAADRYDIQQLKLLCENELSEHIGVTSVASTLALAEQHQCIGLKEACLKFIQVQSLPCLEKLMETDDWKQITGTYGSVLNKLIVNLMSNQKTDKKRKR